MRFKLQSENQYSTPADPGISQAAGGVGVFRFFAWCVYSSGNTGKTLVDVLFSMTTSFRVKKKNLGAMKASTNSSTH